MDVVTGLLAAKGIQEVGSYVKELFSNDNSDFNAILSGLVQPDSANNVNEEELFASLVTERISKLSGTEAAAEYQELLESEKAKLQRPDGVVSYETAANNTLKALVDKGTLTSEEADKIHAQAFEAAQLDDNLSALYDGRGSAGDPTIALMEMESALEKARLKIEAFDNEEVSADTSTHGLNESSSNFKSLVSSGSAMDGEGGFLWKPVSDSNGKLVVLLPANLSHEITQVLLKDESGNVLEEGQFSSFGNADSVGERAHYRFKKAGGDYPNGTIVEVTLQNGETVTYTVSNTSSRCD